MSRIIGILVRDNDGKHRIYDCTLASLQTKMQPVHIDEPIIINPEKHDPFAAWAAKTG